MTCVAEKSSERLEEIFEYMRQAFSLGSDRSKVVVHCISIIFVLLAVLVQSSDYEETILNLVDRSVLFNARDYFFDGKFNPASDERLKILALDDPTAAMLGEPSLDGKILFQLLENLTAQNPKAVLIDGLLGRPPLAANLARWKKEGVFSNVHSGMFVGPKKIPYRAPFQATAPVYKAKDFGYPPAQLRRGWRTFSYHPDYGKALGTPGHINYFKDGVLPLFVATNSEQAIPHLSLYAASSYKGDGGELFINDELVDQEEGQITINYRPPATYYKKTRSLRHMLRRAAQGIPEKSVKAGDIVLIILGYATGTTDFIEGTPYGHIPGGLLIASTIDDILLGTFLETPNVGPFLTVLLGFLGAFLGLRFEPRHQWIFALVIFVSAIEASIMLFSLWGIVIPFTIPLLSYVLVNLAYSAHKGLTNEIQRYLLERNYYNVEQNYYNEQTYRAAEELEKDKLNADLTLGRAAQEMLLPKHMSGSYVSTNYQMSYSPNLLMSGDWLYHWGIDKEETRFILGDVAGKGAGAAITVTAIISTLSECEGQGLSYEAALEKVNLILMEMFSGKVMTTASGVVLRRQGNKTLATIYNAAGPGWFLLQQNTFRPLLLRGTPIGISNTLEIPKRTIALEPGSMLLTFSDGYAEGSREIRNIQNYLNAMAPIKLDHSHIIELLQLANSSRSDDDKTALTLVGA